MYSQTPFNPFKVIVVMPRRLREYKLLLRSAYDSIVAAIDDAMERICENVLSFVCMQETTFRRLRAK